MDHSGRDNEGFESLRELNLHSGDGMSEPDVDTVSDRDDGTHGGGLILGLYSDDSGAEDEDNEYRDAEEGDDNGQYDVEMEEEVDEQEEGDEGEEFSPVSRLYSVIIPREYGAAITPSSQLVSYLRGGSLYRETRGRADPNRFPKVPSQKGRKLMEAGRFGALDPGRRPSASRKPKPVARRVFERELGVCDQSMNQSLMAQQLIPTTPPDMVINYHDPVCCGQFSDDGNFFYACVKDFRVRMYDTSNPHRWRYYKTVSYPFGSWTLTDADLSPDNRWLVYTSLEPRVCFTPTDPNDTGDPYALDLAGSRQTHHGGWHDRAFAIYSIRFSGDGRTIVAGTGANTVVIYDIQRREVVHSVRGHHEEVNAVCFADKSSPYVLLSGSDDCAIKIWDTRNLRDNRPLGAFVGHTEGLTYIDSKGDGRYVLSNGKDQTMKLWDLRMAYSNERYEAEQLGAFAETRNHWDYRWGGYDMNMWRPHPKDNSLVTFMGHTIERTLIRCHFSPPGSTDSRYVYSGSHNGLVHVWNMDGTRENIVDVKTATKTVLGSRAYRGWETCVRDVAWHPNAPLLVASSWQGPSYNMGTVTLHSFDEHGRQDPPDPPLTVDERLLDV